jgi:hypothetical protein
MKCEDCRWWSVEDLTIVKKETVEWGYCHRYPPDKREYRGRPTVKGGLRGNWPETYANDFCSEFAEKDKP